MYLALRVRKEKAEKLRRKVIRLKVIDRSRRIIVNQDYVEIPVLKKVELEDAEIIEQASPVFAKPRFNFDYVKEKLSDLLSKEELKKFRGGWELIGDILIVNLPDLQKDKKREVGKRLKSLFPKVKTIVNRKAIRDEFRKPEVEIIYGSETITVHKENYCFFKIDVSKLMFCAGNIEERRRMAFISNRDEVVIDMFAGIGQFTIPLAKHSKPKKVIAIEKNPVAFGYLKENIALNELDNVNAILGDCRKVTPERIADRVIMGYLFAPERFLAKAINAIKKHGVIHYHDLAKKNEIEAKEKKLKEVKEIKEIEYRIVKSYAPRVYHVVFDLKVER